MSNLNAPIVTIIGTPEVRTTTTAKGFAKQIHYQQAQLETAQMRVQFDHEFDTPEQALKVGEKFYWDAIADLVPGSFGRIELARRKTLRPLVDAKPAAPKAA
ncbi:hypothetical protein [Lysobacter capsici]|uniref:hypothetical protein n=1 Tax=Lysobacter capsici TaxID=435897 RepID=UPI0006274F0E|nr:hypothetical protein [Lysobacter capsici]